MLLFQGHTDQQSQIVLLEGFWVLVKSLIAEYYWKLEKTRKMKIPTHHKRTRTTQICKKDEKDYMSSLRRFWVIRISWQVWSSPSNMNFSPDLLWVHLKCHKQNKCKDPFPKMPIDHGYIDKYLYYFFTDLPALRSTVKDIPLIVPSTRTRACLALWCTTSEAVNPRTESGRTSVEPAPTICFMWNPVQMFTKS